MKTVTIHNLNDCTAQEVYDFIAHHLITQGEKASGEKVCITGILSPPNGCFYRMEKEGKILKCAAGSLIPDEDYKPVFESGHSWKAIVYIYFKETITSHQQLISNLQYIHDTYEVVDWLSELKNIATEYNLRPYQHE